MRIKVLIAESYQPITRPKDIELVWDSHLETFLTFCERDFKIATEFTNHWWVGAFVIKVKKQGNCIHFGVLPRISFRWVGWDGYNYLTGFLLHNFEPFYRSCTQRLQYIRFLRTSALWVCSFVYHVCTNYHPNHTCAITIIQIVDSMRYCIYVDGDFMSVRIFDKGYISLHQAGIPRAASRHLWASIGGKSKTERSLAVMIDTFRDHCN